MEWPLVGRDQELADLRGALAAPGGRGLVLAGQAGVGKTRLATELARSAAAPGRSLEPVMATESARGIPFAAVAHLLPPPAGSGRPGVDVLQRALATIAADAGTPPRVLQVDDAHLLDAESATLVHLLVVHEHVRVIATIRSGEVAPDAVAALWKNDLCVRFDLLPLRREAVASLLETVLDGPVEQRTQKRLWQSSRGNVQFLREMVLAELEFGTLRRDGDLWRLTESSGSSPRLVELVKARLGRLEAGARDAVEMLALGEPLGMDLLQESCGEVLDELEQRRIVRTSPSGRRLEVRLDHPVHAEVLRTSMPPSHARSVHRLLADGLQATGCRRATDLLKLAVWSLESGRQLEPALMLRAGQQAASLLDHRLAERLARVALDGRESFDAWLLLAKAMAGQGRGDDADECLDRAAATAGSDPETAALALERAEVAYRLHRRPQEAIDILLRAAKDLGEGNATDLKVRAAIIFFMLGDTRGVEQLPETAAASEDAAYDLANMLVATSLTQVMSGRLEEAAESISVGQGLIGPSGEASLPAELLGLNKAMLDLYGGRIETAAADSISGYDRALERDAVEAAGMWAMMAAELLTFTGGITDAVRRFQESVWLLAEGDAFGVLPMSRSGLARALALAGDLDRSAAVLVELRQEILDVDIRARVYSDRARIWLQALDGDIDGAVALAHEAADRARGASHHMWAAIILHIPVRLGRPASVVEPLTRLAAELDGALAATMARHARVLEDDDARGLEEVTNSFDRMGATVYAAESAAQTAAALHSAGQRGEARRWRNRSILLAAGCQGARTPALSEPVLTAREREVAYLAARGLASKAIAERIEISARTVDNHLASVYRKLGADGRHGLAEILHPTTSR